MSTVQRVAALIGSAIMVAALIASAVAGDRRRLVIYGIGCVWWVCAWWFVERHNR